MTLTQTPIPENVLPAYLDQKWSTEDQGIRVCCSDINRGGNKLDNIVKTQCVSSSALTSVFRVQNRSDRATKELSHSRSLLKSAPKSSCTALLLIGLHTKQVYPLDLRKSLNHAASPVGSCQTNGSSSISKLSTRCDLNSSFAPLRMKISWPSVST
jgi:hypothetical protein